MSIVSSVYFSVCVVMKMNVREISILSAISFTTTYSIIIVIVIILIIIVIIYILYYK